MLPDKARPGMPVLVSRTAGSSGSAFGTWDSTTAYPTTCNRTLSCSCKQATMLNRFSAAGFPFGQSIFQAGASSFFNNLRQPRQPPLPLFVLSEGAGAFMPLKPCTKQSGFSPGPFISGQRIPGLVADPSAVHVRGIHAPAPSGNDHRVKTSAGVCGKYPSPGAQWSIEDER